MPGWARGESDFAGELIESRRAVVVRIAGDERLIAVEDAARYRDGLGAALPGGLPEVFLAPVPDALDQLVRRWARTHGPFLGHEPAGRFGLPIERIDDVLGRLVDAGTLLRGEFRPEGTDREWCDAEVLRILRQRSLAILRKEVEPTEVDTLVRFLPAWQGVGGDAHGLDRLHEVVAQLQGASPSPRPHWSATSSRREFATTRRGCSTSYAPRARSCGSAPVPSATTTGGFSYTSAARRSRGLRQWPPTSTVLPWPLTTGCGSCWRSGVRRFSRPRG